MKGVVIDKKLFSRVVKDRKSKVKEKEIIQALEDEYLREAADLKEKLVEKLHVLVSGKTSQGVFNNFKEEIIPKKSKFTQKQLMGIDYSIINPNKWTTDKSKNHGYKITDNQNAYAKPYFFGNADGFKQG